MGAVMSEAWLWLVVAFILGVVVGYYLRRYTIGGSIVSAKDPVPTETEDAPEPEDEGESADVDQESAPAAVVEPEPEPATRPETEPEPEPEAPSSSARASGRNPEEIDVDTLGAAVSTFASLSQSGGAASTSAAENGTEDAVDPEPTAEDDPAAGAESEMHASPAHASRRRRGRRQAQVDGPYGGAYGETDTGSVFVPEEEALRVPLGRRDAEAARSAQSGDDKLVDTEADDKPAASS